MARGRFVVLDGPDGAGKSTQVRLLTARLTSEGIANELIIEPGYTPLGVKIRALLLDEVSTEMTPLAQMFLFNADRAQTHEAVRTYLAEGKWVIADRSWLSTIAYQCFGGGFDQRLGIQICRIALGGVQADLMILLTVSDEIALTRRGGRGVTDRFE